MPRSLRYGAARMVNRFLLRHRVVLTPTLYGLRRSRNVNLANYAQDYVRYSMWELIAHEMEQKCLPGSVAEVGVYRGDSAKLINALFPARTLYLFDTFEGFDRRDLAVETRHGYSSGKMEFTDTNVETVLAKMPHRQQCVVRKGYFPDTVKDLDEPFVFVSLDLDLNQPIHQGLKYFYPRLVAGGCIFVHDYNHEKFKGAQAAVRQFSQESGAAFLPIPDTAGSVVFLK